MLLRGFPAKNNDSSAAEVKELIEFVSLKSLYDCNGTDSSDVDALAVRL